MKQNINIPASEPLLTPGNRDLLAVNDSAPARILIVDDDEMNCKVIKKRLARMGYEDTNIACDGVEALACLRNTPAAYDLVLLDVMMPRMDGHAVLAEMQADERLRSIPVIMISAVAEGTAVLRCIENGAIDYLHKPFNKHLFETRVTTTIRRRRLEQAEKLHLRDFDQLTNMRHLHRFVQDIDGMMEEVEETGQALISIIAKMDQISTVTNAYGVRASDELTRELAGVIREVFTDADLLSSPTKGEFAVISRTETKNLLEAAAGRIKNLRAALKEQHFVVGKEKVSVTASIGVAFRLPGSGCLAAELVNRANVAMKRVAEKGGGDFLFYDPILHAQASRRLRIQSDLRGAETRGEFLAYFQPIMCLRNGRVTQFEALMRWRHPQDGFVSPAEFIPIAEETAQIEAIGRWVLGESLHQAKRWPGFGPNHVMNVNVSGRQFANDCFVREVKSAVTCAGLAPPQVKLEITESTFMDDPERALNIINILADWGVRFAVDDFGTGHSSLAYLVSFPFSTVKIDRAFITGIDSSERNQKIVKAITNLAHDLEMTVVAEGIETMAEYQTVKKIGIDLAQGFLIGRPCPADDVRELLEVNFFQPKVFAADALAD